MVDRRDILKSALVLATGAMAPDAPAVAAPVAPAASPASLLINVVRLYGSMSSYQDSGAVIHDDGEDASRRIQFTNLYRSPSLFRFAFARAHPYPPLHHIVSRYEVGFDGAAAYFIARDYEKAAKSVPVRNVDAALARATGISSGAAHTLSRLLLRDISGLSLLDLIDPRVTDDVMSDGTACHFIAAQHPSGGEWGLRVEKATLLIRSLRTAVNTGGAYTEEVHDNIRVNHPVAEGQFKIAL